MSDRDANHITVIKAITDDAAQDVVELLIDPATDRVLIEITPVTEGGGTLATQGILKRDSNHITVVGGVTDNSDIDLYALLIDNRNGLLYLDVEIE